DLYHAARERNPADRAALLQATDPELRSQVERMLAHASESGILDRPAAELLEETVAHVAVSAGTQLGPYRIDGPIGSGGMASVYRATDTRLGRVVAIKIAMARYGERFESEARVISTLNHPNICTLHDVGPNYLVMELIEGATLAEEIARGPMPIDRVARCGAQIAAALAEAHAHGIVHRDLKPANIMVTRHGLKVLDFGLAKVSSEAGLTESNVVMGTPVYMAPEQIEGSESDARTDLFALGLVLYEMTTGRLPFPGKSLGRMLAAGSAAAAPPMLHERAEIPASLDALVAKLLQKDPAKRCQSAAEVAAELSEQADRLAAPPGSSVRSLLRPAILVPAALV